MDARVPQAMVEESTKILRFRLLALLEAGLSGTGGRLPPDRDLSAAMAVGRRSIRWALEQLEAERLWRKQGKGPLAGQPPDRTQADAAEIAGDTNIMEIMEARNCIEPALAGLCALRAGPADIERMRNLARRVLDSTEPQAIETWEESLPTRSSREMRRGPSRPCGRISRRRPKTCSATCLPTPLNP